jgi:outer membrane protein TolC
MRRTPRNCIRTCSQWLTTTLLLAGISGAAWAEEPNLLPQIPTVPPPAVAPALAPAPAPQAQPQRAEPVPPQPKESEKEPEKKPLFQPVGSPLSLAQCLDLAMQNQPAIKAAQHGLASATRGYLALGNMRKISDLLSPDLPFRRMQAQKGIIVSTAEVQQAQRDTTYDVTRMYYTFVYAKQQEQTAASVIEDMELYYKVAEDLLKAGGMPNKRFDQFTLYALEDVITRIRRLRDKAVLGQKQAILALKEAMGIDPNFPMVPKDGELPVMAGEVTADQVVELALARRAELVQAAAGVDVFRLEVCAQASIKHRQVVATFAQGSDLHSRVLPLPVRNGEYRPGAIQPEMPTMLVGRVQDRVARATDLSARQDEVYNKVVGLIRLEAGNAFLNWQATAERVADTKKRFERGRKLVEEARAAAATKQDPELLVRNEALSGETQAEYVEAVFKHLEALILLEKVTAGGVLPAFPGR